MRIKNSSFTVSHPDLLETVEPKENVFSAYFFQSKEKGIVALLFHPNGNKEEFYFDEMDLYR